MRALTTQGVMVSARCASGIPAPGHPISSAFGFSLSLKVPFALSRSCNPPSLQSKYLIAALHVGALQELLKAFTNFWELSKVVLLGASGSSNTSFGDGGPSGSFWLLLGASGCFWKLPTAILLEGLLGTLSYYEGASGIEAQAGRQEGRKAGK